MKLLSGRESIEFHRKTRFVVQWTEAALAFETHCHVFEYLIVHRNRGTHICSIVPLELFEFRRGQFDVEVRDGWIREEVFPGLGAEFRYPGAEDKARNVEQG